MATKSKTLPIGAAYATALAGAVGQEVIIFAMQFTNTTGVAKTVTVKHFVQAEGVAYETPIPVAANATVPWTKVALQPGDYIDLKADVIGVNVLISYDQDDGTNPVASGIVPRGEWTNVAAYDVNHMVSYDGEAWVSLVDGNVGNQPDTSPADWMLFASVPEDIVNAAVDAAVNALVDGAPGALNTLSELAAAIGDDANFAATVTTALNARALSARTVTGGGLLNGQGGDLTADRVFTLTGASLAQLRAGQAANVVATPEGLDNALEPVVVADASTVAWDLEAAPNGVVSIAGSRTIGQPTNAKLGKFYTLRIESTGAYTPSFHSCFDFGQNGAGVFPSGNRKYGVLDVQCVALAPALKFRSSLWKGS